MVDFQHLKQLVLPACEQFGVQELSLFGSRARGDACGSSDYDFVVTFDCTQPGKRSDRFFGLLFYLEDHLSQQVDLLERDAIHNPYLLQAIERDKKPVYEARSEKAVV